MTCLRLIAPAFAMMRGSRPDAYLGISLPSVLTKMFCTIEMLRLDLLF
jgi:hypothetical protein